MSAPEKYAMKPSTPQMLQVVQFCSANLFCCIQEDCRILQFRFELCNILFSGSGKNGDLLLDVGDRFADYFYTEGSGDC